jgi:hypothetical protein
MHVARRGGHLEVDDDLVPHQQAGGKFANDHAIAKDDGTSLPNPNFRISRARAFSESCPTNPYPGALATLNAHEMIRSGASPKPRIPYIPAYPANPPQKACLGIRTDA